MTTIPIAWGDITVAGQVGLMRAITCHRKSRQLEAGRTDTSIERHVIGAIGEFALAKHLGVFWDPRIGQLDTKTGDVAGYQVRATTRRGACLIVKPEDPEADRYCLVEVDLNPGQPYAHLKGSLVGRDARQDQWWRPVGGGVHHAAWFVPANHLEAQP